MNLLKNLSSRRTLIILNSQSRSFSSSVNVAAVPAPTTLPPPITESSQRHFIEHLAPHLTSSAHHLLHPLILTAAANPTSILDELARVQERLITDALISFYCEMKKPDLALECFYLMKEKGFLPKIETCNQMLMLFLTLNRTLAGEFIRHMETLGAETAIFKYNNTVIHHDGGKFEAACVMFQAMKDSDLYSSNSYIFVMCKEGRLEEASDLLPEMLESESGLVPHPVTYDALIHKCCKKIKKRNLEVVGLLPEMLGPMIDDDNVHKAIAYKDEMISKGIEPTLVTYTLLIDAMCEIRGNVTALDLIDEMREKGLLSDVYTYNTLMSGLAKCKQDWAHEWFYPQMVEKRIQPTLITYNTRMLGYCRYRQIEEAQKVFEEMKTRGIKPDHISYNVLINGYGRRDVKEALRLRDEMLKNGFDLTIATYDTLIKSLCLDNEVAQAEELHKEMFSRGLCTPDDTRYIFLIGVTTYSFLARVIKEAADRVARRSKIQEDP